MIKNLCGYNPILKSKTRKDESVKLKSVIIFLAALVVLVAPVAPAAWTANGHAAGNQTTFSREKFAILISGRTEARFRKNLGNVYRLLLKKGYQQENIFILDWNGQRSDDYPVTGPAHWQSIEKIFSQVDQRILQAKKNNRKADLFLYVTDHGIRNIRVEYVGGEYVSGYFSEILLARHQCVDEVNLAWDVNAMHFDRGIFFFAQCFSGGFAQRLSGKNRITIAASAADKESWDMPPQPSFTDDFLKALEDPEADLNGDGKVDIPEAFYRAWIQSIDKEPKDTPLILVGDEVEDLDL